MIRLILKLISIFLMTPLVCFFVYHQLDKEGFFQLAEIDLQVQTQTGLKPAYLNSLVVRVKDELERYKGQSLTKLDLPQIYSELGKFNWIQEVHLSREWPSSLKVVVVPQEVKFLMMNRKGDLFPVLSDGQLMDSMNSVDAPDVTILDGENFFKNSNLRKKAIQMLDEIPERGIFSAKNISQVRYESKEGFWVSLIKSGVDVKMGDDQFVVKGARVGQVLDYLESNDFKARVIDANLSQKVLVRLRKDP